MQHDPIAVEEATEFLTGQGIRLGVIGFKDQTIALPTPEWMTGELGPVMDKVFFYTGIRYIEDVFECNKYTEVTLAISFLCWAKTPGAKGSLALGHFGYYKGVQEDEIVVAIHRNEQGKLYLGFYEPQPSVAENSSAFSLTCLIKLNLDPDEIRSCLECSFP
jgi:hypothetical protein